MAGKTSNLLLDELIMHRMCKIVFLFSGVGHPWKWPFFVRLFSFARKGSERCTNLVRKHVILTDYEKLEPERGSAAVPEQQ